MKNKKNDKMFSVFANYSIIILFILCILSATLYMGINEKAREQQTKQQETAQVNK